MTAHSTYNIPIDTLRYIVMLDNGINFKRIAIEVGKTRQAVSQAVATAEKRTGLKILSSKSSGAVLTEQGERMATFARKVVAQYDYIAAFVSVLQKEEYSQQ